MIGGGFDESVPFAQSVLQGAARNPLLFRVTEALDMLVWLGIGGTLLGFAGLFSEVPAGREPFLNFPRPRH